MEKIEKFNVGDLCIYNDIPVIILQIQTKKYYSFKQLNKTEANSYTSYLCLFYDSSDNVTEKSLRKI